MKKTITSLTLILLSVHHSFSTASFSETFSERIVSSKSAEQTTRVVIGGGSFSLRAKLIAQPSDSAVEISNLTPVTISIGNWIFQGVLGDDPKFVLGKSRSVTFPLVVEGVRCGVVSIAASRNALTYSVSAKTGTNNSGVDLEASPFAESQIQGQTRKIPLSNALSIPCSISFSGLGASGNITLVGSEKSSQSKSLAKEKRLNNLAYPASNFLELRISLESSNS